MPFFMVSAVAAAEAAGDVGGVVVRGPVNRTDPPKDDTAEDVVQAVTTGVVPLATSNERSRYRIMVSLICAYFRFCRA